MLEGLVFGWRSAVLTVAVVQLLAIAAALSRTLANCGANRTLAAPLVVLAGIVTPWLIGFAGFYDRWRWLTFAPFQITLAVGPLIWLYAQTLVAGRWPPRGWRHLIPAMVQAAWRSTAPCLPRRAATTTVSPPPSSVAAALRDGSSADLLDLALDAGFSSKASFNRAFLTAFGTSPSAYRRHVAKHE